MPEIPIVHHTVDLELQDPGTFAAHLAYPNIAAAAIEHGQWERDRRALVWDSEPGSMDERFATRQLAAAYMSCAAAQVVAAPTPALHDVWAKRFTDASIELYGSPEPEEATRLVGKECQWLRGLI